MSSILTNYSAMTALQTLRGVNSDLGETQNRISTGLKVRSGKDNAAYFNISNTMRGDSGMYKSINEGLTMTKNSVATARSGAEALVEVATEFVERVSFAQGQAVDHEAIQDELNELVGRMVTIVEQSTFNGDNFVGSFSETEVGSVAAGDAPDTQTVVTGVTRSSGTFGVTTLEVAAKDLAAIVVQFDSVDVSTDTDSDVLQGQLTSAAGYLDTAIKAATSFGVAEKSIEVQQGFLSNLVDEIDGGIGGMVDADMEQEASRLQALQVQQQLATQSLSIANQNPQNILALFR